MPPSVETCNSLCIETTSFGRCSIVQWTSGQRKAAARGSMSVNKFHYWRCFPASSSWQHAGWPVGKSGEKGQSYQEVWISFVQEVGTAPHAWYFPKNEADGSPESQSAWSFQVSQATHMLHHWHAFWQCHCCSGETVRIDCRRSWTPLFRKPIFGFKAWAFIG